MPVVYELAWFFAQEEALDVPTLIALGKEVDGGVNAECNVRRPEIVVAT